MLLIFVQKMSTVGFDAQDSHWRIRGRTKTGLEQADAPWIDIGIYVELFASTGRYQEAIQEAKALARWVLGRESESYWRAWFSDDREWDVDDERRASVSEFRPGLWSPDL